MSYLRFAAMIATSTVVMFGLMYLNTFAIDHVFWSQARAWMALLMGAFMAVIMLLFMLKMYKNRAANIAIIIGAVTIIIGHTVFVLALVYRTILTRLQSLSGSLVEASYDLGASRWQTFRLVLLPNLSSAMVGAAVLAFALSFDETMITLLVTGTQSTLPVRLWAMMRLGFTPDINALVAFVLLFTTALCLIAVRFLMPRSAVAGSDED